jgi:glycosyltransferase involved in cell wall biosynthesis
MSVQHKGLDILVRGYAQFLARTRDEDTLLHLIGPDFRGGRAQLERLVRELQIAPRVVFHDAVFGPERWAWLSRAYVFVHPSRWEGLPNAVLEALAASCPVLITPGTNMAEFVRQFEAGVVVGESADEVGEGLRALVGLSPERHVLMGQSARRLVDRHFTWSACARRLADAYLAFCGSLSDQRPTTACP